MVYSNKFVMCIIIDGKIQKELANGTVIIPFGSEYTIRFRNKNDRRAVVKFKIDGEDSSGNGYIINANSYVDIKRYAHKDCAFKFVSLNGEEAIDFGKNGDNSNKIKGLIESTFYLEKNHSISYINLMWNKKTTEGWDDNHYWMCQTTGTEPCNSISGMKNTCDSISFSVDDGATVEGKATGQHFNETFVDTESDFVVLKLFLQGTQNNFDNKQITDLFDIEQENKNLRRQIEQEKKRKEIDVLLKENKKLKEELNKLKNG